VKQLYHPYTDWECVAGGMYEGQAPAPLTPDEAREQYKLFLSNLDRFESVLNKVLSDWPISCEQFLSNENVNRIAWLGQSSMCLETRVPSLFCGGFRLLSVEQQIAANAMALKYLNIWLRSQGENDSEMSVGSIEDEEEAPELNVDNAMKTIARINHYISTWKERGYSDDIPDEVPSGLTQRLLAPSYKAIVHAILKNDMPLKSLGFVPKQSQYYGILKRIEIEARPQLLQQLRLF